MAETTKLPDGIEPTTATLAKELRDGLREIREAIGELTQVIQGKGHKSDG